MQINWMNYLFIKEDGYGRMGMHLVRNLHALGVEVLPMIVDTAKQPQWLQRLAGIDYGRLTIALMPGHEFTPIPGRQWLFTMTESEEVPKGWTERINWLGERLLVPCEWCADVFKAGGVKIPIHVVHGGTPPEEFPVQQRVNHNERFTFLALGDRGGRKGHDLAWLAFVKAFGTNHPAARMVIKARGGGLLGLDTSKVTRHLSLWREDVDTMADVYAQADCLVYPTRGEGWGMPPREAACMGIPVICTDYSGTAVGIDHWALPLRNWKSRPSAIYDGAPWAEPDVDEIAEKMLWVYEHRDEAKCNALKAAQWIRDNQTWRHSAESIMKLIQEYG